MEKKSVIRKNLIESMIQYFRENAGILIGLLIMCVFMSLRSSVFLTGNNISNVLRQVTTNANLAFGMTFAIILCGIDLSVGSILAFSGTLCAGLIANSGVPVPLAVLCGILAGTLLGFINGFIIAKTQMPPFIVTLAMMQIARGAAYVYTNGMPIRVMVPEYNNIGIGYLGIIPLPVIYTGVFFVFTALLLGKTRYGKYVYAVGGNEDAARFSGINIGRVKVITYTLIGFLASVSGIVICARMYSGQPTAGDGAEMDAIAAVVLGGTSFSGGIGKIGGTLIGVFIIGVLNNGLNLLNVNSFWQLIAKGLVILLAVYIDLLKKKTKKQ
ncbi:ribose ABC transporter permease [Anaerosacchariphilus polymeriproducens]|uniref:Ribose ABC transporter permease n=1 Tax=Anaerosacchariphilus polymeriproducens TaxID=1812858 RepID=A0A371ARP0_9FIRM|nr:ribose ABC transporter permease [Anaerosacchariphilus polymeriproducens]RDU22239.1 ribose ABC transporter permease [Anaerosacchariphilus polymeriproducens]